MSLIQEFRGWNMTIQSPRCIQDRECFDCYNKKAFTYLGAWYEGWFGWFGWLDSASFFFIKCCNLHGRDLRKMHPFMTGIQTPTILVIWATFSRRLGVPPKCGYCKGISPKMPWSFRSRNYTRCWFQTFFIFTPILGEDDPIWRAYFSNGWEKTTNK